MSRQKLKSRDKITQKMSRDGLVQRNETQGEELRISKREAEMDLRGETQERQALSQAGTKPGGSVENRTKFKQRQIEAFRDNDAVSDNIASRNETPPAGSALHKTESFHDARAQSGGEQLLFTETEQGESVPVTLNTGSEQKRAASDVPHSENPALSVNPRDPPKHTDSAQNHDSLFQLETRSDEKSEILDASALKHEKSDVLRHEPEKIADVPKKQPGKNGKLQTQKASAIQHDKPVDTPVSADKAAKYNPNQQNGEGKRRVQDNTAYRQKNLAVPPTEVNNIPVTSAGNSSNEPPMPTDNKQPVPTADNAPKPTDAQSDTPPKHSVSNDVESANTPDVKAPPKVSDSSPDSQLKSDKPGKLKFASEESASEKPMQKPDRRLIKAERQAEQAINKLEKAKNDLPAKKKLRSERVFDEQTGKATQKLRFEKEILPQGEHLKGALPLRPVKTVANVGIAKLHSEMFQVEHENVEVKAAHRTEMAAEGGVRSALRFRKTSQYKKVAKLEKLAAKKSVNLSYRKALADNPKLRSNVFSRMWQKRKLRKDYAKKARDAKKAAGAIKQTGKVAAKVTQFLTKAVMKNPKVWIAAAVIGLILLIVMSMFSLATSIGSGGMGAVLASTYLSEAEDMEEAALAFSEWETDLALEILDVQINHPGFHEYRFNIGGIGHCPVELMAFLTAVHHGFTFEGIESDLRALFDEMYSLTFTPSMEIRFAPPDEPGGEPIPYEWHIMTVTLASQPFSSVIQANMTPDQQAHFEVLMGSKGNRQIVGSPFDFYWFPFVSSHYGFRVHPISGERSLHRGIDIGLPTGTPIRAAHDGLVTVSQYMGSFGNVVFIVGDDGIETRYAHADTLLVNVGDTVAMGDIIATVGSTGASTGPHLHFEILVNGSHVNPAFFAHMGG